MAARSLVQADYSAQKVKRQALRAKVYFAATLLTIVICIVLSVFLVVKNGQQASQVNQIVEAYRVFADNNAQLDEEVARLNSRDSLYDYNLFVPKDENITDLTRLFDRLFAEWDTPGNPITNTNLTFGAPTFNEELQLNALPITMTLSSSQTNFDRLLFTVETSGIPLSDLPFMDVQAIALNLNDSAQVPTNVLNYTVTFNAYYQANNAQITPDSNSDNT